LVVKRYWLPWAFISQDCVEDRDQLSSDGDEGDELWFSGSDELVAEAFEHRIEARGDHRPDE
jgi:hypothetical protein